MQYHLGICVVFYKSQPTCTVGQITDLWRDEFVDKVIAPAGFHLDGRAFEVAAVFIPVAADFAGDDAVTDAWVATHQPQRGMCATHLLLHTALGHLDGLATVEQAEPAIPLHITVAGNTLGAEIGGSPRLVQCTIVIAGVLCHITAALIFIQ